MSSFKKKIPHRLSRGLTRGASDGMLLASDESLDRNTSLASGKYVTAAGVGPNTSRPPCKVAGESVSVIKGVRLKVGSVNMGSMRGKSGEIAEMAGRRKLDI